MGDLNEPFYALLEDQFNYWKQAKLGRETKKHINMINEEIVFAEWAQHLLDIHKKFCTICILDIRFVNW